MTVKELKDMLYKYPDDMRVALCDDEGILWKPSITWERISLHSGDDDAEKILLIDMFETLV